MEFRQLKTFRVVADTLNFTRAARSLFMAQSSVSAQIKAIEEELGVRLFDRIGKSILLTDAGRLLYGYARRMEDMTMEIRSEITGALYAKGSLTIRVPESLASVYMPGILTSFHEDYPEVRLNCINCTDRQLREELNSGRIDLAFLMTDDILFKEVNVKLLREEKLILVSGPMHPLAASQTVALKNLHRQTLLLPNTD